MVQHSLVSGSACMEYVNLRHADLGEQTCSSNKKNVSQADQSCLSVVLRVTDSGFQPSGEIWNITEGSDNSSSTEDYGDDTSEVTNDASEVADNYEWPSPFLLDTERDGEPHILNVSNGNDSETQYIFVTALRTCWSSEDMYCYAKHCIVVLTNLAIANNSRWFVCCCTGPNCNQRTYIVHESGLKRSAAGMSAAYTTFRARALKTIARRLRVTDDDLANILIESARRGVQQHSSRGSSLASRLMASFNQKELAIHNVTQSDASADSETLQTTFSGSEQDSGQSEFLEVREVVVSAFVVILICVLLLLVLMHFRRKRTTLTHGHVRAPRRRQTSTRSLEERPESLFPVALSPFFAKQQERFVFKRAALRCEELVARGRFCSVWRGALLQPEVAANMPVAVKVFERQARTVWANEAAVYAHLIEYASSRPELRYAETCSWDELWGAGTVNAQSSYSSQSVSTKCETTVSTCTSETATEQSEERSMRDALALLGSVSILRFVGVCINDPREDDADDDDRSDLLSLRLGCSYQLVTEYQSLGSLNDFLQRHLLSWHDALRVAHGIAAGLSFLHRSDEAEYAAYVPASTSFSRVGKAPIAHRDIKSKNILLRADLHASICDFGLALILDDAARAQLDESSNSALLQCGTRVYMSPELLTAVTKMTRESFIATDVYAFALVLYELLTRIAELRCVQTIISPQAGRCSESESAIAMDSEEDSRGRRMTNALCPTRACTAASGRAVLIDASGCVCGRSSHERCAKASVYEHGATVSFDDDVQPQLGVIQQTNAAYAPETTESVVDISRRSARFRSRATLQHEYDCDCVPFACTYRLPFTRETGCTNPDLETLRRLVATQNYRPPLVEFDREGVCQAGETQLCTAGRCFVDAVREYSRTVEQSWDVDADARLSAATICVRLKRLLRDCDGDAACRCALRFIRSRK